MQDARGYIPSCARLQAAVDERDTGTDILLMARTDARATDGLEEAIRRARAFADIGVDITFLEAPRDEAEMLNGQTLTLDGGYGLLG